MVSLIINCRKLTFNLILTPSKTYLTTGKKQGKKQYKEHAPKGYSSKIIWLFLKQNFDIYFFRNHKG